MFIYKRHIRVKSDVIWEIWKQICEEMLITTFFHVAMHFLKINYLYYSPKYIMYTNKIL